MDQTRSLPYDPMVRQTGEGLAVTELVTASSTPGLTLMLQSLSHVPLLAPCTTPTLSPSPAAHHDAACELPRTSTQCCWMLWGKGRAKGTWFVMDVAQGTTFGCHMAQVDWLVNDLNLSV